jgi:hypothetical protein
LLLRHTFGNKVFKGVLSVKVQNDKTEKKFMAYRSKKIATLFLIESCQLIS